MRFIALLFLILALPFLAAAQTPYTVLIDLSTKNVEATNRIAIRETVPVRLVNTDIHAAGNLVLRISADTQTMAIATAFATESPGVAAGLLDLNTQEFVDYFEGAAPQARRVFTLAVWDTLLNRLLVNAQIQVQNNPYQDGMPGPSPIGVSYLPGQFTGTNWVAGGIYQATETPGVFRLELPDSLVATTTSMPWGAISGDLNVQTDLVARLNQLYAQILSMAANATDGVARAAASNALALANAALTNGVSTGSVWGAISGDITTQTDLVARLDQISENLDNAVSDLTNQLHGISLYTGLVDVVMSGDWYSPEFVKGINLQPVPRSAPSSNEVVDLVDMRVLRQYSDQVAVDWQLSPESLRNRHDADLIWSVLPTNKASVSSNGFLTSLASGVVTVRLDVGVSSDTVEVPASLQMDLTVDWQLPGATNYLRFPLVNGLYSRATNGPQSVAIMSSFNHAQTSYVYATTGLLAGVDLSPFPVRWSRWGTRWIGGALITSNIVITTHHLRPLNGDKVWFLTTNNVVVEREVVEQHYFAYSNSWVDVALSKLDSPVTGVEPVHAPPPTWGSFIGYQTMSPDVFSGFNLPTVMIDQFFNAHVATLREAGRYTPAAEPWFSPYYKIAISGDSGSPLFFMAGNTPVLIGAVVMNTWKPGMGNLLDFRAKIEEGITALSPGASLNYFDPTGYTPLLPLPPGGF